LQWVEWLHKAMGYSDMTKYYSLQQKLGEGQFGVVKLATHKQKKTKAAVKQVKKKNMTEVEVF